MRMMKMMRKQKTVKRTESGMNEVETTGVNVKFACVNGCNV